jgi:hypothetical protein
VEIVGAAAVNSPGSIHKKETVVETTVEVPVQPVISLQESKIYLLANGLTVSRDYYFDPATNQTRYTLRVKNNADESVRLVIKDAIPKTFANTTAGFKVKPVPTTIYEEDPVIGWEVVLGPNLCLRGDLSVRQEAGAGRGAGTRSTDNRGKHACGDA